jgi:hypothetical protein
MLVEINLNTNISKAISIEMSIQKDIEGLNIKMLNTTTLNIETYNDINLIR